LPVCSRRGKKERLGLTNRSLKKMATTKQAAPKTNRSKKKLSNRAKTKSSVLKRRRVRARKSKGK
jgi:hypothetical protein